MNKNITPEFIFDAYAFFSRPESDMDRDVREFMRVFYPLTYAELRRKSMDLNCRMLLYNLAGIHLNYFVTSQFFLWDGILIEKFVFSK